MNLNRYIVVGYAIPFGVCASMFDVLKQFEQDKVGIGALVTGSIMSLIQKHFRYRINW